MQATNTSAIKRTIALVLFFLPPLEPPRDPPLELLLELLEELPAALLRLDELLDPFLEEEALLDADAPLEAPLLEEDEVCAL